MRGVRGAPAVLARGVDVSAALDELTDWALPDLPFQVPGRRSSSLPPSTQVIWWVGLGGALVLTLVILKQVALVLRVLRDIHRLAGITRDAAQGVAANLTAISKLGGVGEPALELRQAVGEVAGAVSALERRLRVPVAGTRRQGG